MKKYFSLLIAVLMISAIICGCSQNTDQPSNGSNDEPVVFRMLYDVENTTLNYLASGKELEHAVACNMVDGLVEFDNHSNIVPAMAESWTTSDDGLVWTFKIRQGQKWYDNTGKEIADVTANDWVSGLKLVCDPKTDSGTYDQVKVIKGAEAYFNAIDSSYDKGIMEQLQSITASSPGITILSRYEKQQEMAGYLLTSRIIAAGLSTVFLLIGIMNFINTMVVSVNTRKHEFATLESIGMTKKQIRNVLLWEGGYYWSISFLLLATLGTAIYIPIYSAFRRMVPYAAFHYPVISLLVVAAIVLLVCLATPVITFMQNVKQSVVERLRQN